MNTLLSYLLDPKNFMVVVIALLVLFFVWKSVRKIAGIAFGILSLVKIIHYVMIMSSFHN